MKTDLRKEPREKIRLPVGVGASVVAVTRDISASGMYIEVVTDYPLHGQIELEVELELVERTVILTGCGEILRVDRQEDRNGLAVRLQSTQLKYR